VETGANGTRRRDIDAQKDITMEARDCTGKRHRKRLKKIIGVVRRQTTYAARQTIDRGGRLRRSMRTI
jgi:hypothetical protein